MTELESAEAFVQMAAKKPWKIYTDEAMIALDAYRTAYFEVHKRLQETRACPGCDVYEGDLHKRECLLVERNNLKAERDALQARADELSTENAELAARIWSLSDEVEDIKAVIDVLNNTHLHTSVQVGGVDNCAGCIKARSALQPGQGSGEGEAQP